MSVPKKEIKGKQDIQNIVTLDGFDVTINGHSLVRASAGSKKIWELYMFMMTHRDHAFTPEGLIDGLWEEHEYSNPRGTLRRQMHRLREVLGESNLPPEEMTIQYINGYYQWNPEKETLIDAEVFEMSIREADRLLDQQDHKSALKVYRKGLSLYGNDYLDGVTGQHWVFPARNHYRRIFLRAVGNAITMLNDNKAYEEVIDLCQRAIQVDIYEEIFHIHLIGALLGIGEKRQAFEHYDYIAGFYERELGIMPSEDMQVLYGRLQQNQESIVSQVNLKDLLSIDLQSRNAFVCEPAVFRSIHELEQRRCERSGESFGTCLLTVSRRVNESYGEKEDRMATLKRHLIHHLRKGDTLTRWNDEQLLLLLPGVDEETISMVVQRILEKRSMEHDVDVKSITFLPEQMEHHRKYH